MNEDRCQVDGTTYVAQTYAKSTAHCTGCAATAKHLLPSETFRLCQSLGSCAGGYRKDGRNVHWIKEQPESKDA